MKPILIKSTYSYIEGNNRCEIDVCYKSKTVTIFRRHVSDFTFLDIVKKQIKIIVGEDYDII